MSRATPCRVLVAATLAVALVASPALALTAADAPARPSAALTDVDWPQFRFNDRHTGFNPLETVLDPGNVPSLQHAWKAQLGRLVDFSSPAVVGGVAYIGSSDGVLWAYPASGCGKALCTVPLWRSTSLAQIVDSPTVSRGTVYVGSQTSANSNDGRLNAFPASGCGQAVCAPEWRGLAGQDSILESSPTVAGGTVFVGAYDGKLYAFDADGCGAPTCQPLWTGATGGSIESTPTVRRGVVYIGSDAGNLYAFDAHGCGGPRCRPLWTGSLGGPAFQSSPAVAGGVVYIASQHALSGFDASGCGAATCPPLWQAIDNLNFFDGSPAVARGRVYIGLENGLGVYAAPGCGQPLCDPLWTDFGSGQQAAILSSPTVANGVVYAGRNTAEVLAWRAASCGSSVCANIWSGGTEDQIVSSSPTVVNGRLYIGSADKLAPESVQGRLYVFELP